jgi:hypothetical protein
MVVPGGPSQIGFRIMKVPHLGVSLDFPSSKEDCAT